MSEINAVSSLLRACANSDRAVSQTMSAKRHRADRDDKNLLGHSILKDLYYNSQKLKLSEKGSHGLCGGYDYVSSASSTERDEAEHVSHKNSGAALPGPAPSRGTMIAATAEMMKQLPEVAYHHAHPDEKPFLGRLKVQSMLCQSARESQVQMFCLANNYGQDVAQALSQSPDGIIEVIEADKNFLSLLGAPQASIITGVSSSKDPETLENTSENFRELVLSPLWYQRDLGRRCLARVFLRDYGLEWPEQIKAKFLDSLPVKQNQVMEFWLHAFEKKKAQEKAQEDSVVAFTFDEVKLLERVRKMLFEAAKSESLVELFIQQNQLDPSAANKLRTTSPQIQHAIVKCGEMLVADNPSACVVARVSAMAQRQEKEVHGKFPGICAWSSDGAIMRRPPEAPVVGGPWQIDPQRHLIHAQEHATGRSLEYEQFLAYHNIDDVARKLFYASPPCVQKAVVDDGPLVNAHNPNAVLTKRINRLNQAWELLDGSLPGSAGSALTGARPHVQSPALWAPGGGPHFNTRPAVPTRWNANGTLVGAGLTTRAPGEGVLRPPV